MHSTEIIPYSTRNRVNLARGTEVDIKWLKVERTDFSKGNKWTKLLPAFTYPRDHVRVVVRPGFSHGC